MMGNFGKALLLLAFIAYPILLHTFILKEEVAAWGLLLVFAPLLRSGLDTHSGVVGLPELLFCMECCTEGSRQHFVSNDQTLKIDYAPSRLRVFNLNNITGMYRVLKFGGFNVTRNAMQSQRRFDATKNLGQQ